jgi:Tol biopolymer transport system component
MPADRRSYPSVASSQRRRSSDRVRFLVSPRRLLSVVIIIAAASAGLYVVLTDRLRREPAQESNPVWTPDSAALVFAVRREGQTDLMFMHQDGTGRRVIAGTSDDEGSADVARDGRLAFSSVRNGNRDIYVSDLAGGPAARVTTDPAADTSPAWSPTGEEIVFVSDRGEPGRPDLYRMKPDGSAVTRLTSMGNVHEPQYSPDGRMIAFEAGGVLRLLTLETGGIEQVIGPPADGRHPTWSPDSRELAFETRRNGRSEIFRTGVTGAAPRVLVSMPGGDVGEPQWAPDGRRLAFVYRPTTFVAAGSGEAAQAIYSVELDSGRLLRLSE